jgi:hypothetical protein
MAVFGRDQPDAGFQQQAADDGPLLALEDLEHAALGPAALVEAHDAHAQPVAMHDGMGFLRGEVDVGRAVIGNQEAMAVPMALQRAFDFAEQAGAVRARGVCCVLQNFDAIVRAFLKRPSLRFLRKACAPCPGGGIGRRTSFRY